MKVLIVQTFLFLQKSLNFNLIAYYKKYLSLSFVLCISYLSGQQTYFQQEVNYKINVTLNDRAHSLKASEEIQYINNSDKGLDFIYFHLWPNAYKNSSTALAKQLLEHKKTDLYYSTPAERGFIDSLDFKVNGKSIKWEVDPENPDICKLILNEPLRSLDTLKITTPFYVKIPDAKFSRLGHTDQAYFITQWYPKPAVYDNKGWHPMPYLDQGEFYSEFGSFDVSITLPKNYLLSATGDRIDAEAEEDFLNEKVGKTLERLDRNDFRADDMFFPESSKEFKTVRFKQFRVHDFAWFADKRFNVLHDQIQLPYSKRTVDTWVFFTNKNFELWKDAVVYVNESTIFYSFLNGDYPYNNITAVDGTIMAGGGMEYPNITVIGDMDNTFDLDVTIAHEVGHNWFYGILGSNERDFPALDEGLNSFYEMRYTRAKYPARKLIEYTGRDSTFKLLGANKIPFWREKEVGYFMAAKARTDQPINLPSQDFTSLNYGLIVYAKTAIIMDYLMEYMGEETFDKAMQFYYEQFKFKHPYPEDLIKTLSYFSGMDLNWFSQNLMNSDNKIDYKIKKVKRNDDGSYTLKLKNKTGTPTPVNVYGFKDGKPHGLVWFAGFTGTRTVGFPAADVDYFKIDGLDRMPDINRKNNFIRTSGIFKKLKPLQFDFLTKLENPAKTQINYLPFAGVNFYNGPMLGLAVHNYGLYEKKFEYLLAPMFGFKNMSPAGFAEFNYNIYPGKVFRKISIGTKVKSFAYDYFETKYLNQNFDKNFKDLYFNYIKIAPHIDFEIKKKSATSPITQWISYSSTYILIDSLNHDGDSLRREKGPGKIQTSYFVNELSYMLTNTRTIDPFVFRVNLQHNAKMAKAFAILDYKITFSKKHFMDVRLFAGSFIYGSEADKGFYSFKLDGYNGRYDYLFNYNYIARNEWQGLGANQFTEVDGALKVPLAGLGNSTQWAASVNLKSPRIFILPVRLFFDAGVSDGRYLIKDKVVWCGGINVTLWKDIIEIYFPLAYNKDTRDVLELNNIDFWQRIRFTLNIHKLAPKEILKNNLF
ncbi:MAG: M1 family metallopeptidase [Bacteroidetes bacterium]|nr:M1 family metallopeptidase [Bacteroidota bacterium]